MVHDIERVLLSEMQLEARVRQLGEAFSRDYGGMNPLFVGVLKGSFVFMADLIRRVTIPCGLDFVVVSSYGERAVASGSVRLTKDVSQDVENRHIILVEDILDSGHTIRFLLDYFTGKNPASIKICTLLDKPERRAVPIQADYLGFTIPDEFVVGYGLDYSEGYRNLPFIGVLKREVYE